MRPTILLFGLTLLIAQLVSAQTSTPPSVPVGVGRAEVPGVTRTVLKEDAKSSVVRVRFEPGAKEVPHTHAYDVVLVPCTPGQVDFAVGEKMVASWKIGEVQFIPRDTVHHLANTGREPLELIAVGIK